MALSRGRPDAAQADKIAVMIKQLIFTGDNQSEVGVIPSRDAPHAAVCGRQPAAVTYSQHVPAPREPILRPGDDGQTVLERVPQKVEPPPLYRVLLLNDDYTPMEFVVMILQEFFNKDRDSATQIMLRVHVHGKGVCGVYTADIAETKVDQVLRAARHAGHPLQCVSEPVD